MERLQFIYFTNAVSTGGGGRDGRERFGCAVKYVPRRVSLYYYVGRNCFRADLNSTRRPSHAHEIVPREIYPASFCSHRAYLEQRPKIQMDRMERMH